MSEEGINATENATEDTTQLSLIGNGAEPFSDTDSSAGTDATDAPATTTPDPTQSRIDPNPEDGSTPLLVYPASANTITDSAGMQDTYVDSQLASTPEA